jgi:type II secretory ATPase GspE/PulE/Tfp pilus assembly ATPase PilB-like protein
MSLIRRLYKKEDIPIEENNSEDRPRVALVPVKKFARMAELSVLLPKHISERYKAIILDCDESNRYTIGMLHPSFVIRVELANIINVPSQTIKLMQLMPGTYEQFSQIAYGNNEASEFNQHATPISNILRSWNEVDPTGSLSTAIDTDEDGDENFDLKESRNLRDGMKLILREAFSAGASDIYLEQGENVGRIRFRINDVIHPYSSDIPIERMHGLINTLAHDAKVSDAGLKHRIYSAAIKVKIRRKDGNIIRTKYRIEFCPTIWGISVTMRLQTRRFFNLERTGLEPGQLLDIYECIEIPDGVVLLAGPTGSGKSNTLEGILQQFEDRNEMKIVQFGDPVEFPNSKRTQIEINREVTWMAAMNSALRQKPDVISPGEVRTKEQAQVVIDAALTGHIVPTTIHSNDAASTFARLASLGIEYRLQADAIRMVIAQRLVNVLCNHCKRPYKPSVAELSKLGIDMDYHSSAIFYTKAGCRVCSDTGFSGERTAFGEVLRVTPDMAEIVASGVRPSQLAANATSIMGHRMVTMRHAAARKVMAGITTFAEIQRVLNLSIDSIAEDEVHEATVVPDQADKPDEEEWTLDLS